jgi:hypothetical protein
MVKQLFSVEMRRSYVQSVATPMNCFALITGTGFTVGNVPEAPGQ